MWKPPLEQLDQLQFDPAKVLDQLVETRKQKNSLGTWQNLVESLTIAN